MRHPLLTWPAVLAVICALGGCVGRDSERSSSQRAAELARRLDARQRPAYVPHNEEGARLWKTVVRFYEMSGHRLAWIADDRPRREMDTLVRALKAADREGLNPSDYDVSGLAAERAVADGRQGLRKASFDPAGVSDLDIRFTYMFMRYASHLLNGRVNPKEIDPNWQATRRSADLARVLLGALDGNQIEAALNELAPPHPEYAALRDVLGRYREIASAGGWPLVPQKEKSVTFKKGVRHPKVPVLARRLALVGDLAESRAGAGTTLYDEAVARAVRNFETRHGLQADGVFDPEAAAAMNVPVEQRIRQIELNMERWRWLPDDLGARHIRVNIPAYRLEVIENEKMLLAMRVVVGKADSPTPIFSDQMTTVIFRPYWNIPEQIVRDETIPALLKDSTYLERNNIEIVRGTSGSPQGQEVVEPASIDWSSIEPADLRGYAFRQRPGSDNALGLVKFIFPNHFNVYMHDTPADRLFQRVERDFSHGCVRLEQPVELAELVLRERAEWTRPAIENAMHARQERQVGLREPIPVHLTYFTVMPYDNGAVQFREDVYGHDRAHARLVR